MATSVHNTLSARKRLGRIRCVQQCINCFVKREMLPKGICYVPLELQYKSLKNTVLTLYKSPTKKSKIVKELICGADQTIITSGEDECNNEGQWTKLLRITKVEADRTEVVELLPDNNWMLLYSSQITTDQSPVIVQKEQVPSSHLSGTKNPCFQWQDVVDDTYSLQPACLRHPVAPRHEEASEWLGSSPPNWTLDHDEDLAQFLCEHTEMENDNLGSIKNYVEAIDVSTFAEDEGAENLTDGDPDTCWESDGQQGHHWIRLKMKKGTIIKKLLVTVDPNDDNYLPHKISVMGGTIENLRPLKHTMLDTINDLAFYLGKNIHAVDSVYLEPVNSTGLTDICVLGCQKKHHPVIEIRIKECKDDGIDTRIHAIKIQSVREKELGLNKDLFCAESLVRFPKLETFGRDILYCRALLLQRFMTLLDSVLPYLVPTWEFSEGSFRSLQEVRQLLPMSKRRTMLIDTFLKESETSQPLRMPKLYINRRAAADHKADPSLDPSCKDTVFSQVYEGLKPRDRTEKPLDYRWSSRYDQWWECKFLSEGIIDQGGGFRDSLSDLADELCPSDREAALPLPFFVRAPNQNSGDANVNKDVYIPNPDCDQFSKYEWVGKVMGACLRGKESLVLSLPPFVWKKLVGESVTWSKDYSSVDEAEVRLLDNMMAMDQEAYEVYFGEERTWSVVLSGGRTVSLHEDGENQTVVYTEREEYVTAARAERMGEADRQIASLRDGLLRVVPQAALDLLTWQELEKRICGDPEITIEALRRATHYEDLEESDSRVQYLWLALAAFSMEERSRFLRFVTGRRRLPAPLFLCPDKGEDDDALPESSTCSNTLYLPNYSSAKTCEEKLRYAAYNCIAIDTDMSPWDD